jgi:hypothetical protein
MTFYNREMILKFAVDRQLFDSRTNYTYMIWNGEGPVITAVIRTLLA